MLLGPRKTRYRKSHKGRTKGIETRGTEISFGDFGLKALTAKWITGRQIEAARRAIIRYLKKGGNLWIRIFPYKPVTTKGGEAKMGHGKGAVDHYVHPIKPGRIIFELGNISEETAKKAFRKASTKLPIKTKMLKK